MDPQADPRVQATAGLVRDLLTPGAERVDVDGVPRSHIAALADAGLLALHVPDTSGAPTPEAVIREVTEQLAAADATTWFVWTQHKTPVRALLASENGALRAEWLPRLTQRSLGAVAFSHLRRRNRQLTARRCDGGWRLDGTVSWLTGWGLADVVLVSADAGDAGYAHLLVDAVEQPGLTVSGPLPLPAMAGTGTVAATLHGLVVPEGRLVSVADPVAWHAADEQATADVSPAVFGVTRGALAAVEAPRLQAELDLLRAQAYAASDADAPLAERVRLRAAALDLCLRATAAAVSAVGGRAMSLDHPAQRRAREALFLLVQAQTADLRAATIASLGRDV